MAVAQEHRAASGGVGLGDWPEGMIVGAVLALHVFAWTTFATLSHAVVHHDMTEAFAWGQEWQPGYFKHPPFFGWMAAAWFLVFPRQSWAFFLLSEFNAALGLAGAWAIARRILPARDHGGDRRCGALAVLAMLGLTPLYGLAAMKFNANTALLSLWPWTTYALIRMLEQPRGAQGLTWGLAFGLLAAASFLTKYYSGLLLVSCLCAALLHPNARAVFTSVAPYAAVLVGSAAIAPHLAWLVSSGYQPLEYAAATTRHPTLAIIARGAGAVAQAVAVHVVPMTLLWWSLAPERRTGLWSRLAAGIRRPSLRWVLVLTVGPFLLSFVALAIAHVRISAQFMIPIFFMVPTLVLMAADEAMDTESLKRLARPALAVCFVGLVGGPVGAFIYMKSKAEIAIEPREAVSREITRAWHAEYGRRLEIVSGDETYSQATSFYSPDQPSDFTAFNLAHAPWITRQRLSESGLAILCKAGQYNCLAASAPWTNERSRRVEFDVTPRLLWLSGRSQRFVAILVPPEARQ